MMVSGAATRRRGPEAAFFRRLAFVSDGGRVLGCYFEADGARPRRRPSRSPSACSRSEDQHACGPHFLRVRCCLANFLSPATMEAALRAPRLR